MNFSNPFTLVGLTLTLVGIGLIGGSFGCSRNPPLDDIVAARSDFGLLMWKADVAGDFTREEWHDFDEAVKELKYTIMASGEASGSDGVRDALLQKIDGKSVRQVLALGLGDRLRRLTKDRDDLTGYLAHNQRLRTKEGDNASADYLDNVRDQQAKRLELLNEQIDAVKKVLLRRGIVVVPGA